MRMAEPVVVTVDQEDIYNPAENPWLIAGWSVLRERYRATRIYVRSADGALLFHAELKSRPRALRARRLILKDARRRADTECGNCCSGAEQKWNAIVDQCNRGWLRP